VRFWSQGEGNFTSPRGGKKGKRKDGNKKPQIKRKKSQRGCRGAILSPNGAGRDPDTETEGFKKGGGGGGGAPDAARKKSSPLTGERPLGSTGQGWGLGTCTTRR